jgi:hypothetical protein
MLFVVYSEWKAEDVPKVVEVRRKNPVPKEIKILGEAVLFGQHKNVSIFDAPDEKTLFTWFVPFLQLITFKVIPALKPEDAMNLASG